MLLSLNTGPSSTPAPANPLEDYFKITAGLLPLPRKSRRGWSSVLAFSEPQVNSTEAIRLRLGRILALGLEFTVASDILRTAVAPTRQDILNLGAIVLLRTLLNYVLEHEIRQAETRKDPKVQ